MNKGSILGRFGERVKRTADSLLRHRLVSLAASDAHSPLVRTTAMDELTRLLERRYGSGCPWLLLEEKSRQDFKRRAGRLGGADCTRRAGDINRILCTGQLFGILIHMYRQSVKYEVSIWNQ